MPVNDDERKSLSFKMGELEDLGITSTQKIIGRGESFLDGKPDDVEVIDDIDEEDNEEKAIVTPPVKKKVAPTQKIVKQEAPNNELSEEDAFDLLDGKGEQEVDEAGNAIVKPKAPVKKEEEQEDAIVLGKKKEVPAKPAAKAQEATPPTTEDENDEDDPEVLYTGIAAEMVNQGIFEAEEDENGEPVLPVVKSPQEFLNLLHQNARRVAGETIENFLDSKGEEARAIFQAIIVDGVNPREYINRYAAVQDFKSLDLTDELNQEKVVREFYRQSGLPPESIDRKIKNLKDTNDLLTEAEDAKKVVVKREEDSLLQLANKKKQADEDKAAVRNEFLNNVAKIINEKAKAKDFDGIPIPDNKSAQELFDYLTAEKYRLDEQLLTEFDRDILELNRPVNHAMKVKVGMLIRMLKADPKLSTLSKKAVSKESSSLFQGIRKKAVKAGETSTQTSSKAKESAEEGKGSKWFAE